MVVAKTAEQLRVKRITKDQFKRSHDHPVRYRPVYSYPWSRREHPRNCAPGRNRLHACAIALAVQLILECPVADLRTNRIRRSLPCFHLHQCEQALLMSSRIPAGLGVAAGKGMCRLGTKQSLAPGIYVLPTHIASDKLAKPPAQS